MNRRRNTALAAAITTITTLLLAVGCGGGGGEPITGPGPDPDPGGKSVSFVPDASPGQAISMTLGETMDAAFEIEVRVANIDNFFGAGFRVYFDDAAFDFVGFSSDGSFIDALGVFTEFDATSPVANEVWVRASRDGLFAGVPSTGSAELLITLNFLAVTTTAMPSPISYDTPGNPSEFREVTTCPTFNTCDPPVPDDNLTWAGGELTVTE